MKKEAIWQIKDGSVDAGLFLLGLAPPPGVIRLPVKPVISEAGWLGRLGESS